MGLHLRTPNRPHSARVSSVVIYAQDGGIYDFGRGKNKFHIQSQRFIIFSVSCEGVMLQCEFSIEERWTDYKRRQKDLSCRPSAFGPPMDHTICLARKEFHHNNVFGNSNVKYETCMLIKAFDTASKDVAMDIFQIIFHELILNPEIEDYFENPNHEPGFIETWVPEYFKSRIRLIMQERERKVEEVHKA